MSKRVLIALVIIVIVIVGGMALTMKRAMKKGSAARDASVDYPHRPGDGRFGRLVLQADQLVHQAQDVG